MTSRGERHFVHLPRVAARLYDRFLAVEPIQARNREVAEQLVPMVSRGRLLDVGMGPGRLLIEIHRLNPALELYGLDISAAMVAVARRNLGGIPADLRRGTIRRTAYDSDSFSLVTCTGSFYLWDYPEESLDEIFRILEPGRCAYLFEVYRDLDRGEFEKALQRNLRLLDPLRRFFGRLALREAVNSAYRAEDVVRIVDRTRFAHHCAIERMRLSGLPMWMRITLSKCSGG